MTLTDSWKRFESTGQIGDYLTFKHYDAREDEWDADEDYDDGPGTARNENGRGG